MNTLLSHWLLATPIWLIGILLFAGMILAAWLGYTLRQRRERAKKPDAEEKKKDDKGDSQEGLIISAVMGLLALLVGFTFSLALDRYDTRRMGVLEEANTIGTTYLRTQMVDAPYRQRLSGMLSQYADNRLAVAKLDAGPKLTELLARNDQLVTDMWTETVAAWPSLKHYDFSSSYLDTMNAMIDMDATRRAARRAHVPAEVFLLLFIYQFVAAGVIGYVLVGDRGRQAAAFLFLLFGLSLLLVIDLDRPTNGGITVSQQPMLDLQAMIRANPPPTFDRFNGTRTAVPAD
jgi:hypothetical protein